MRPFCKELAHRVSHASSTLVFALGIAACGGVPGGARLLLLCILQAEQRAGPSAYEAGVITEVLKEAGAS